MTDFTILVLPGAYATSVAATLDILRAAALLAPRLAVPIHWGTFSPLHRSTSADPPETFRRHAAELAPDVEVRILAPGTALTF